MNVNEQISPETIAQLDKLMRFRTFVESLDRKDSPENTTAINTLVEGINAIIEASIPKQAIEEYLGRTTGVTPKDLDYKKPLSKKFPYETLRRKKAFMKDAISAAKKEGKEEGLKGEKLSKFVAARTAEASRQFNDSALKRTTIADEWNEISDEDKIESGAKGVIQFAVESAKKQIMAYPDQATVNRQIVIILNAVATYLRKLINDRGAIDETLDVPNMMDTYQDIITKIVVRVNEFAKGVKAGEVDESFEDDLDDEIEDLRDEVGEDMGIDLSPKADEKPAKKIDLEKYQPVAPYMLKGWISDAYHKSKNNVSITGWHSDTAEKAQGYNPGKIVYYRGGYFMRIPTERVNADGETVKVNKIPPELAGKPPVDDKVLNIFWTEVDRPGGVRVIEQTDEDGEPIPSIFDELAADSKERPVGDPKESASNEDAKIRNITEKEMYAEQMKEQAERINELTKFISQADPVADAKKIAKAEADIKIAEKKLEKYEAGREVARTRITNTDRRKAIGAEREYAYNALKNKAVDTEQPVFNPSDKPIAKGTPIVVVGKKDIDGKQVGIVKPATADETSSIAANDIPANGTGSLLLRGLDELRSASKNIGNIKTVAKERGIGLEGVMEELIDVLADKHDIPREVAHAAMGGDPKTIRDAWKKIKHSDMSDVQASTLAKFMQKAVAKKTEEAEAAVAAEG